MKVKIFPVGYFGTNCYVIMDESSSEIAVIDPGDNAELLIQEINKLGGTVKYVLLTHVHADHTGAVEDLIAHFKVPVYSSQKDEALISKGNMLFNTFTPSGKVDGYLEEGKIIKLGESEIKCIETPGHTPGGISFLTGNCLFSGDTLFKESVGRTDFLGEAMKL